MQITAGSLMIDWICNIIVMNSCSQLSITEYLICNKIFSKLSHIITNKYVIEECLLNKFLSLNCDNINTFLDLMWTLLEEQTIHDCLEFITRSIINGFRFSPIILKDSFNISNETPVIDFEKQKQYLLGMKCLYLYVILSLNFLILLFSLIIISQKYANETLFIKEYTF